VLCELPTLLVSNSKGCPILSDKTSLSRQTLSVFAEKPSAFKAQTSICAIFSPLSANGQNHDALEVLFEVGRGMTGELKGFKGAFGGNRL